MFKFGSVIASFAAMGFLRTLRADLKMAGLPDGKALAKEVRHQALEALATHGTPTPDKGAALTDTLSSLLYATFTVLNEKFDNRGVAYALARDAMMHNGNFLSATQYRIWLFFTRNPVEALHKRDISQYLAKYFGSAFETHQTNGQDFTDIVVTRCGFHEFFRRAGEPQLAQIMCAWDRAWMDVVNQSKRPISIRRSSTIATGSHECRFRFAVPDADSDPFTDIADPEPIL